MGLVGSRSDSSFFSSREHSALSDFTSSLSIGTNLGRLLGFESVNARRVSLPHIVSSLESLQGFKISSKWKKSLFMGSPSLNFLFFALRIFGHDYLTTVPDCCIPLMIFLIHEEHFRPRWL